MHVQENIHNIRTHTYNCTCVCTKLYCIGPFLLKLLSKFAALFSDAIDGMYVCMFVCMYVFMYLSIYLFMYVYMYVCMYVSMYTDDLNVLIHM